MESFVMEMSSFVILNEQIVLLKSIAPLFQRIYAQVKNLKLKLKF